MTKMVNVKVQMLLLMMMMMMMMIGKLGFQNGSVFIKKKT